MLFKGLIGGDQRILSAPLVNQFEALVLKPTTDTILERPLGVVLDGIDEPFGPDLLELLSNDVADMNPSIKIFLTSHMIPEMGDLQQKSHVRYMTLDITAKDILDEIGTFIAHCLRQVADRHELPSDWPGEELARAVQSRAGGLFIWVAAICDHLFDSPDPTAELRVLVSRSTLPSTSAEHKMDHPYLAILQNGHWGNQALVDEYHRLMGASGHKASIELGCS
ncbi:hypothetical protein FRC11_011939, partial [Ceratobasidium sp. 423]